MSFHLYTLKQINNFIKIIKDNIIFIGTTITIIFCIFLYISITTYGKNASNNFSSKETVFILNDTIINNIKTVQLIDSINRNSILVNPTKYNDTYTFNRIISQLKTIKYRAASHNRAIDYFIINFYFFIIVQSFFMVIVVLLGLVVSRSGWGSCSNKLLATFLISCGFLLLFKILPMSMKIEDNIASNKANFLTYCSIENHILTYLSNDVVIENFTRKIDIILKKYHAISFELQQVSISDVQEQLNQINSTNIEEIKEDSKKLETRKIEIKNTETKNNTEDFKMRMFYTESAFKSDSLVRQDTIAKQDTIK